MDDGLLHPSRAYNLVYAVELAGDKFDKLPNIEREDLSDEMRVDDLRDLLYSLDRYRKDNLPDVWYNFMT
jgi:hypothetical protein